MGTRMQSTTPFKEGQNTITHGKDAPKVKVVSNASQSPSADPATGVDHLRAALAMRQQLLPSDNHEWTHTTTVRPVGAHYTPMGEYGNVRPQGKGQGVYSYRGAPNRKGENALGKAMNRVGEKSGYKAMGRRSGGGGKGA